LSSRRHRIALDRPVRGAELCAHGAEEVRELERERARSSGERQGLERSAELLDRAVAELEAFAEGARASLARTAVELALEIARVLLRREIARGNYDLERIVRETLGAAAVGRGPCVVHLNPEDHERLSGARFRSGTRLERDEGVARGDVHVETSLGLLARDVDAALEAIGTRLSEELG
jgi:flagellar biosynthesis/type III secretory pathway protein FliH